MKTGWRTAPFEHCIETVTYTPKVQRKDFLPTGRYPIISQEDAFINGYWDNEADIFKITKPVVVFGDHTKALKYVDFDFVLGADGVKVLQPREFLEPKFLYYALQAADIGSLGYARHYRLLKQLDISYPPVPEQRRVVAILDEAFEALDASRDYGERNLKNAHTLFESHLQSVFTQRGAAWELVTLEILLERGWILSHLDGNHGSDYPRKDEFINEGVPYISANCIHDDQVDMARAKYLSPKRAALLRKGVAKNDDVLFAHNATVGPVAILKTDEEKVILGTSLTYYRCNRANILPEYLAHYMRSSGFKTQYFKVMRQSTRNQVPITKQREFFHVIPPVGEQQVLVRQLDSLLENGQRLASIYQKKIAALEELKTALLYEAFSGQF